jgi:5-formyltetrahydrofolate cyclo-ligase
VSPDPSRELKRAKRNVRVRIRALRDALSDADRTELGARAVGQLLEVPEVVQARTVMAFWSFGSEVPTAPLIAALHERGIRVALPRIRDGELLSLVHPPGAPTTATAFGAREPFPGAGSVDPAEIDVVVTPGLAFDRRGMRVGYGGGFYDRFFRLAASRACRVGLAFSLQLLEDELPAGPGDIPVHAVVTEREVVRIDQLNLNHDSSPRYNRDGPVGPGRADEGES